MKILVIDDEAEICNVISTCLIREGYEVFSAHNGREGLEMMCEVFPDLIILDILMPDMNGFEVGERIKNDELHKNIPIIIMTGNATAKEDKLKGYKTGAYLYLEKPFDIHELIARINVILKPSKKKLTEIWEKSDTDIAEL